MPQFCNRVASWDCVKNIREMEGRPGLAISERLAFNRFSFSRADVRRHRLAPAAGSRATYRFASRKSTHGPAFPARPADRPTIAAHAMQTNAAARADAHWSAGRWLAHVPSAAA